eukprot:CAMPEP_0172187618 /NCGR_PEP_ID=MMETSP1050-20130122/21444_1 /TAXON_ID=233186 /ORGANISM="Cryptomonas curvata, Strain CCAP979/52" /LENGTH=74 /DNA_ID=CAMNT_0012861973 /DNA_START=322 /DNA_END=542 /DNA_ORIENTATION=-
MRCIDRSAGSLLFDQRRWLDPRADDDRARLLQGYRRLRERFPALMTVHAPAFLEAVVRMRDAWAPQLPSSAEEA